MCIAAPQLGGDEELASRIDDATSQGFGDGFSERLFGLVDGGGVEVAVAELDGMEDGELHVLGYNRPGSGAHADQGNGPGT